MCFKSDRKCLLVAILSTIFHTILLCISITTFALKIAKPDEDSTFARPLILRNGYGNPQYKTFYALDGILIAFGLFGITMSVLLMIGLKNRRYAGFMIAFLCYAVLASILLLLTGIILLINGYWRIAIVVIKVSVLGFWSLEVVYRAYEDITQDSTFERHNSISNVTLLTEDFNDLTDDTNQERC